MSLDNCQQLLAPFARVAPEEFIFSPRRAALTRRVRLRRRRKSPVPPSQRARDARSRRKPGRIYAERYDAKSYALAIRRACKKAKVPQWTPHQLRHARISEIAHDPRLGARAASIAANHSSLAATERYIHRDRRVANEVAVTSLKKA